MSASVDLSIEMWSKFLAFVEIQRSNLKKKKGIFAVEIFWGEIEEEEEGEV